MSALQENVAIAAVHLMDTTGKYIHSPITIEQACQLGKILWDMGYRKTELEIVYQVQN